MEANQKENNAQIGDSEYTEDNIKTLRWDEHIRKRPCMYVGAPGDGTEYSDALYVLFKGVIDNSVNEFIMSFGKILIVNVVDGAIEVRDFGRGIPLGSITVR